MLASSFGATAHCSRDPRNINYRVYPDPGYRFNHDGDQKNQYSKSVAGYNHAGSLILCFFTGATNV